MSVAAHTAAAFLARRIVEGIAFDLNANGRDLGKKLADLRTKGAIEGRLADWANALRLLGNDAAHEVNIAVSHEDATDALAFAEALADYVYTFRRRFDRFEARRNKSTALDAPK